jgi:hypothetical protein
MPIVPMMTMPALTRSFFMVFSLLARGRPARSTVTRLTTPE